jgi:hypothetical protein
MKAAAQALAENPSWSKMPKPWLQTALWAFRYVDEPVPTRNDIAQALVASASAAGTRDQVSQLRCTTGKRGHGSYEAALRHLMTLQPDPSLPFGSIYTCPNCSAFHISSRRFTLMKPRGRGKARRGLVGR